VGDLVLGVGFVYFVLPYFPVVLVLDGLDAFEGHLVLFGVVGADLFFILVVVLSAVGLAFEVLAAHFLSWLVAHQQGVERVCSEELAAHPLGAPVLNLNLVVLSDQIEFLEFLHRLSGSLQTTHIRRAVNFKTLIPVFQEVLHQEGSRLLRLLYSQEGERRILSLFYFEAEAFFEVVHVVTPFAVSDESDQTRVVARPVLSLAVRAAIVVESSGGSPRLF